MTSQCNIAATENEISKSMNYKVIFIIATVVLLQPPPTAAEEDFENSTNLCSGKCSCNLSNNNTTLYIDCASRSMQHTIANWPEHPQNLVATFSYNNIATLKKMPGSGADDIKLVFSNCKIKYLESGLFESTVNVKFLDLSNNLLESEQLSPNVFKGPYNSSVYEPIALEYLDLAYNQIHSLDKDIFEHTPHLKYLSLEGNRMRVIDHVSCLALGAATQLQILNLAGNRLTELPSDAIKHFLNLTELNLSNNDLDFVPESLGYIATSLQILNISGNPIILFEHTTFEGMENLLKLFSSNLHKLSVIYARSFTPLKHLKLLELSHNSNLESIDMHAFALIEELEEVYLNNNALRTLSPELLPWPHIHILDIRNNAFICDCDLYDISTQLLHRKSGMNAPLCLDPRTYISIEIDSLTNETCSLKSPRMRRRGPGMHTNLKIMRVTLSTLIVVLVISSAIAMWLGYTKWRTYQRSLHYPFPSQVIYSPVASVDLPKF